MRLAFYMSSGFTNAVSRVIPPANDQFAWGRRVHELGVGPAPIARKRLTAAELARAIEQAQSTEIGDAAPTLPPR